MTKKYKRAYKRTCDKKRKQNNQSTKNKKQKIRRLSNLDVSEILITNNIKTKNVCKTMRTKGCRGKGPCEFSFESFSEVLARTCSNGF